jgi:CheY-like chemotaxis protein
MAAKEILVIDDNAQSRKLARIVLEREGYIVRSAGNSEEALKLLESSIPRLILMDLQLPGIDGLTLTRQLKADARYRDIIIIALTAYAMKGDEAKATAAGCDAYLTKPVDIDHLANLVAARLSEPTRSITH